MTVIYVDSVFVLNAVMDYLLCLLTARLAGIPLRRRRYFLAALLGGGYAVAVFWPGMAFLAETPVKLAVGVLLALVAFGGEEKLLRLTLLLFAVTCAMAGCVLGLGLLSKSRIPVTRGIFYTDISVRVLVLSAVAAYGVLTVVFRAAARHGLRGELIPVRLCIGGRVVQLTALWDSGNTLRDPGTGQPVLVTAPGTLNAVLPESVRCQLTAACLRVPADFLEPLMRSAPWLRPRLMPYHAVGTAGGLLLTVQADWLEISGEKRYGARVALSPTELGTGYAALWGGEVRKGGRYGYHSGIVTAAAERAGAAPVRQHPLHRRKRHAAAAPDPGTGGGSAGTAG